MGIVMRQRLVIGNWKAHGRRDSVAALLQAVLDGLPSVAGAHPGAHKGAQNGVRVGICPPLVHLDLTRQMLQEQEAAGVILGAQDVSPVAEEGAFTGEVPASMLQDIGVSHVLVGHSERRHVFNETDAAVAAKFNAASKTGLVPILCVGETLEQRKAGDGIATVLAQLQAVIDAAGSEAISRAVIAYEPVWAIGTGITASPAQAQAVHQEIRTLLGSQEVPILYGGSVKPTNAADLFTCPHIDGGLIGGASLNAKDFLKICRAATVNKK